MRQSSKNSKRFSINTKLLKGFTFQSIVILTFEFFARLISIIILRRLSLLIRDFGLK